MGKFYKKITLLGVLTLAIFLAVFEPLSAVAACSSLVGRATVNELYRGNPSFVEVKLLDTSLDYSAWTLQVCTQSLGCTGSISLSTAQKFGPYLVIDSISRNRLGFDKKDLDIILKDGAGNVIDYLDVNGHSAQAGQCGSYDYPTVYNGNTNSFSLVRMPDGSGPWFNLSSGNSGEETPGYSNEGNNLPQLSIAEVTVPKGAPAVFVFQLDRPATGSESVSYITVDDTALAGTDYTAATNTVNFVAGSTQATVSIVTDPTSPSPSGVFFWLNLSNQVDLGLLNHFVKGSISGTISSVDHFRIEHTGSGLTCQRSDITLRACQNVDCSQLYIDPVDVTLSPSGWVGGDTKTITGGIANLQLRGNSPGMVVLGVPSASPAAANPVECFQGGAPGSCGLEFFDSGFVFDVPDLTSCQASGNVTISAVRTDDTTQRCVAAGGFAGQSKTLNFWSSYLNPAAGTRTLRLNGTALATSAPGTAVTLNFDANAQSTISVDYNDAGSLQLDARYIGSGEEAGLVMLGSDILAVRPFELRIRATTDGVTDLNNAAALGDPKWRAGEDFFAEVRAVCADGTLLPNFAAGTNLTAVAPFEPAAGALGVLTNNSLAAADFAGGIATLGNLRYSEVGTVTLRAEAADYLSPGVSVTGTSGVVGRFTPDHFSLIANVPSFQSTCAAGGFSYLGQPFNYSAAPVLTVTAQNKQNATTRNYTGPWWKISNASLTGKAYAAASGVLDTALAPPVDPVIADLGGGIGTLTFSAGGGIAFVRNAPQAAFDAEIALSINVADGDGIAYGANPATFGAPVAGNGIAFDFGKQVRWGRLALQNAHGSELIDLPMPLTAQYFDGTAFVPNPGDSCTNVAAAQLNLVSAAAATTGNNPIQVNPANPNTTMASLSPLALGDAGLSFVAPGAGGDGYVDVSADLSALFWLQYDWDNADGLSDGPYDDDPVGRVTFGVYQGHPRLIYLRESVQ